MSNPTAPKLALADAIRALAMDAVQQANSGHPGAPMGMAEIAQALWAGNLRHNPRDPAWANRDRFVLSNGHGSMLIYALLHLTGYDLPIEELKNFRQLHSKTPGHPEVGITPGVETTTGPLGQGLGNAIKAARSQSEKPTLIVCRTVIGKGSPNMAGTHNVHGAPLGKDEIAATRAALGWSSEPFQIPQAVYDGWDGRQKGAAAQAEWQSAFDAYAAEFPAEAAEFTRRMKGELPAGYAEQFQAFLNATLEKAETVATRKASQFAIAALAAALPEMLGGSADLTGSNFTDWKGVAAVRAGEQGIQFGRHINYGVREFGMAAIMNGVALHGGYLPFGGTFLTFSDYSRNAIRMAALMKQRVVHVFTHDSIGLGEDGPTHQSIEHASSLRLIPNLSLWRPCDTAETAVAWNAAVTRPASIGMDVHDGGPTALLLSRQNLPFVQRDAATVDAIARGGYVLRDAEGARAVIIATGSEVAIALDAQAQLAKEGVAVRVVSMPSTDVFDRQDAAWKQSVLPKGLPRVAIEAGVTAFWHKYVGLEGAVVGIDRYGESAPAGALFKFFGLTADKVAETVRQVL
jgi:transketolase